MKAPATTKFLEGRLHTDDSHLFMYMLLRQNCSGGNTVLTQETVASCSPIKRSEWSMMQTAAKKFHTQTAIKRRKLS